LPRLRARLLRQVRQRHAGDTRAQANRCGSQGRKTFAQERESVEEAYPGDVIGLNNPGAFAIGDTIYTGQRLVYPGIPSFSPELFANLRNPNPAQAKSFKGRRAA
jgi:peptide subunit release factor RF-3